MSPLLGLHAEQVASVEHDAALRDLIGRMPHDDVAQRALARPVMSHQGVHLPFPYHQVDAFQYLFAVDAGMQIVYL